MSTGRSLLARWPDADLCPYCHSKTGESRACSACGRDVDLLRELRHELESVRSLAPYAAAIAPCRAEPLARRLLSRCGWTIVAILLAEVSLVLVYDTSDVYLYAAAAAASLVSGYSLGIRLAARQAGLTLLSIAATAFLSVWLTTAVTGLHTWAVGDAPLELAPHSPTDWREALRFVTTIALAMLGGFFAAQAMRWSESPTSEPADHWIQRWFLPCSADDQPAAVQIRQMKRIGAWAAAAASTVASIAGLLNGRTGQ